MYVLMIVTDIIRNPAKHQADDSSAEEYSKLLTAADNDSLNEHLDSET